ncbi:MAG TPA: GNAT family protein [Thermomicrobiales bacterium]|nr:GNAT family protein [Thermomicrobiales bacterium]
MTVTSSTSEKTTPEGNTTPLAWEGQTYLVGEEIYLRPIDKDDAKWSMSFRGSRFPLSPERTEEWITGDILKAEGRQHLGIRRKSDERVVGMAVIERSPIGGRWLNLFVDPLFGSKIDRWRLEALRMILGWSVNEQQRPNLHAIVPASQQAFVDGAKDLGMRETATFREYFFRDGQRVDAIVLEYLNSQWVSTLGDPNEVEIERIGSGEPRPVPASVRSLSDPPKNAVMVGERVYLRPFTKADAEQFSIWSRRETEAEAAFNVGRYMLHKLGKWRWAEGFQKQEFPEWIRFAVADRESGELAGGNGVLEVDYHDRRGETESFFLPKFRGKGYGSEGKHLVLDYAFNRLDLHMVTSWVYFPNTRSAAALRKQGYREAGRINWLYSNKGTFDNFVVFDYLADEWRAMPRTGEQG